MKKLLLVLIVALISWYAFSTRPVDSKSQNLSTITIESGWSTSQIADHLKEKGIIKSPLALRIHTKLSRQDGLLQAGKFVVSPAHSVSTLVSTLRSGKGEQISLTIPEGYSVKEIDDLLAEKGIIEGGEIVACSQTCDFETYDFLPSKEGLAERGGILEGYLFPETYFVDVQEFVPKFFIERMLNEFRKNIIEANADAITETGRPLHDLVTMASLIEKESRTDIERPMVADILWKRFDDGKGLGVDATVRYITNKQTEPITVSDLNINSPYNTRKFRGLPPGPIANSGLKSFLAAVHPEANKYWYYLHDKKGKIHYAKTNEEHNVNRYYHLGGGSE